MEEAVPSLKASVSPNFENFYLLVYGLDIRVVIAEWFHEVGGGNDKHGTLSYCHELYLLTFGLSLGLVVIMNCTC